MGCVYVWGGGGGVGIYVGLLLVFVHLLPCAKEVGKNFSPILFAHTPHTFCILYYNFLWKNILCRFLGHFQPQQGKPALWELDSDQHYPAGRNGLTNVDEDGR